MELAESGVRRHEIRMFNKLHGGLKCRIPIKSELIQLIRLPMMRLQPGVESVMTVCGFGVPYSALLHRGYDFIS